MEVNSGMKSRWTYTVFKGNQLRTVMSRSTGNGMFVVVRTPSGHYAQYHIVYTHSRHKP